MGCQYSLAAASMEARTPVDKSIGSMSTASDSHDTFEVLLQKGPGERLGVGLGKTSAGAAIYDIKPGGLLHLHNQRCSKEQRVFPGCIIVEANRARGYWDIFDEVTQAGAIFLVISTQPPKGVNPEWLQEIASLGKEMEERGSPFMLRKRSEVPGQPATYFSSMPTVTAGDVGVDQCSICLEAVPPTGKLMQLPCGHCFHLACAGRWLTEGARRTSGERSAQCCPLCCRSVTGTRGAQEVPLDR